MAKITIDERFLIKIYEIASAANDLNMEVSIDEVATLLNQKGKKIKVIVQSLANCHFIIKKGVNNVLLTPKGIKLVEDLKN